MERINYTVSKSLEYTPLIAENTFMKILNEYMLVIRNNYEQT